eukprot:1193886-Prorocentrum_minimum.AAC.4
MATGSQTQVTHPQGLRPKSPTHRVSDPSHPPTGSRTQVTQREVSSSHRPLPARVGIDSPGPNTANLYSSVGVQASSRKTFGAPLVNTPHDSQLDSLGEQLGTPSGSLHSNHKTAHASLSATIDLLQLCCSASSSFGLPSLVHEKSWTRTIFSNLSSANYYTIRIAADEVCLVSSNPSAIK